MWIPGHADIEGNEQADAEAKRAARDATLSKPFKHRPLKSARVRTIKSEANIQWQKEWNNNTKAATTLRSIMKTKGALSGTKLYKAIKSRNTVSTIARLRTGHCGLNDYLYKFNKRDSPYCECGHGKETVNHYLIECKRYSKERLKLRKNVGIGGMRLAARLGNLKNIRHTMEFVQTTMRLNA